MDVVRESGTALGCGDTAAVRVGPGHPRGGERRVARLDHLGMPAGVVAYSADSPAPILAAG
ncbi:hypothetical protein ABZW30_15515 [Kitasatospora sp. NPDC004669]|uniref:hypothetical protein n=1 Tax=Kitasatospora sp. NPDC004669 TaxID=3154555 RepID=UPI0033B6CA3F